MTITFVKQILGFLRTTVKLPRLW